MGVRSTGAVGPLSKRPPARSLTQQPCTNHRPCSPARPVQACLVQQYRLDGPALRAQPGRKRLQGRPVQDWIPPAGWNLSGWRWGVAPRGRPRVPPLLWPHTSACAHASLVSQAAGHPGPSPAHPSSLMGGRSSGASRNRTCSGRGTAWRGICSHHKGQPWPMGSPTCATAAQARPSLANKALNACSQRA